MTTSQQSRGFRSTVDQLSKLTDYIPYLSKRRPIEETTPEKPRHPVVCSYWFNVSKLYLILIVWAKFALNVYVSYYRQFRFLNQVTRVPEELQPFYTETLMEEAKSEFMFRTILRLEQEYNYAVHLSVIYLSNMYCTIWWICAKLSENVISRAVLFSILNNAFNYHPGVMVVHVRSLLSSISITQGTCKLCRMVKQVIRGLLSNIFTTYFMEELIMAVVLALATTPLVLVVFLLMRLYQLYHPTPLEESVTTFVQLRDDDPFTHMLKELCVKLGFNISRIYVSQSRGFNPHGVQIRGVGNDTCLILGKKLVGGHVTPILDQAVYSSNEIMAAVMRAVADSKAAVPHLDVILEASRWSTLIIYSVLVMFGFYGNSRLGFVPSPPPYIAYLISINLSLPILLIIYTVKNILLHYRHFRLDRKIAEFGMGDYLISYVTKEAIGNNRCPIEDPVYTLLFSDCPPLNIRIRNIQTISERNANKLK